MRDDAAQSDTRTQLIEAAKRVMQRDGAGHLTLDAVAKEAGVSKGGLLYHFPNKQALLRGMIEYGIRCAEHDTYGSIPKDGTRTDVALAFSRAMIFGKDDADKPPKEMIWAMLGAAANDPELLAPVVRLHNGWHDQLLKVGVEPTLVWTILLLGHGMWAQEIFGLTLPSEVERERLFAVLKRLIEETMPEGDRAGGTGTTEKGGE